MWKELIYCFYRKKRIRVENFPLIRVQRKGNVSTNRTGPYTKGIPSVREKRKTNQIHRRKQKGSDRVNGIRLTHTQIQVRTKRDEKTVYTKDLFRKITKNRKRK